MNIDKDKLIEFSAETRKTFTNAKLRVGSDDKRTVHIFTDDELSEFADLVSALAIASLQGDTHKNGWVSVPIEPTDAMLKSANLAYQIDDFGLKYAYPSQIYKAMIAASQDSEG